MKRASLTFSVSNILFSEMDMIGIDWCALFSVRRIYPRIADFTKCGMV
jgi:hypothetical protein